MFARFAFKTSGRVYQARNYKISKKEITSDKKEEKICDLVFKKLFIPSSENKS